MNSYILPHGLSGEHQRLALMSVLLDPMELACISRLGIAAGSRCLEIGCGNGSVAEELAQRVAPAGHVVASDIDLTYVANLRAPCLEVRRIDILHDAIDEGAYDFVFARALLHHLTQARTALDRMVKALKPGGVLLSIEPDMLPCTVAEPDSMRIFWQQWLAWSVQSGIDYFIGRKVPAWLDSLGLTDLTSEGHTAQFNGGSSWALYWMETMQVLTHALLESGRFSQETLEEFFARYKNPHYWTSVITFVATSGRKPL
jgi:SAM-dependent methyltransferase